MRGCGFSRARRRCGRHSQRDRREIGLHLAQVEAIGRNEGSGVKQDIVTKLAGEIDPGQRVLHAGEIGLGGKSEEAGR